MNACLSRRFVRTAATALAAVGATVSVASTAAGAEVQRAATSHLKNAPTNSISLSQAGGSTTAAPARPRVFAYYYLWWSRDHWNKQLGSSYPTAAKPLPLPATLDANGCNPVSLFAGNKLTDVPSQLYSQDDAGFIEADVREAAAAGLAGFAVNWIGTGAATQTSNDNPYSKRLAAMVAAVRKVNAEGIPFKLWMSYKASANVLSLSAIQNDLAFFAKTYGSDPAFDRSQSSRPTVIWQGSRKYPVSTLDQVSRAHRSRLRILGDESAWSAQRAPYLDGNAYYWSSQNPWLNPQSFSQLRSLAASVKASGTNPDGSTKAWIAPLAPGFNKQLTGGTSCVPRRGGQTLRALYDGNKTTSPEAYGLISWNEITESTYVDPMTRYGRQDLDVIKSIIAAG